MRWSILIGVLCIHWLGIDAEVDSACKAATTALTKLQMKMITECTTSLKYDSKERRTKSSCIMKCVLMRGGALDAEGYSDTVESAKFIKSKFPENVWEKAETLLGACKETTKNLNPKEVTCKSYDPMIQCGMKAMNQICD